MAIGNLILTVLMAIPLGQEAADIQVKITLFEVPFMIVTRMFAGGAAKDGGVLGTMVGGSTTEAFPASGVTLQNRMPAGSDRMDLKRVIREFMANDCIRAQDITVNELAGHKLIFDHQGEAGQEVCQELQEGRPSPLSYRLDIEPAWENEEGTGLSLQIWLRWQDPSGIQEISNNIPERLVFDQTVPIEFGQTSLIYFPSSTSGPRSVYWLAISVEAIHAE